MNGFIHKRPEIEAALSACSVSTKATGQLLLPEQFYARFSRHHNAIIAALDDPSIKKVNIISSRGLGKTSLCALAFPLRMLLFRLMRFFVYITGNYTNAVQKTESLKRKLVTDPVLRKLFGSANTSDYGFDESFAKSAWVSNGSLVMPRGALQQIRGLLHNENRPDVIVCDDVENVKAIQSEDARKELWEWLRGDVEDAVPQFHDNYKIVYIDTVKHEACIPLKLKQLPDWHTIELPIAEEAGNGVFRSLIPELVSDEQINLQWQSAVAAGTEDVFYREKMCRAQSGISSAFQRAFFKYFDPMSYEFQKALPDLHTIVIIDPAKTDNPQSAETAIVGVSVNLLTRAVYVRELVTDRISPDMTARVAADMALHLGASAIGIETTGLGAYGVWPLKNYLSTKRSNLQIVELTAQRGVQERGKTERIKGLIPLYRAGHVYHNPTCCGVLEDQLLSFPRPSRWDAMDALAYIVGAMDNADMYFYPEAPQDKASVENEYRQLGYEWSDDFGYTDLETPFDLGTLCGSGFGGGLV